MDAIVKCQLEGCANPIPETKRGRPQQFCCDAHRKAHSRRLNGQNRSAPIAVGPDLSTLPEERLRGLSPALRGSPPVLGADRLRRDKFRWRGLALHLGRRKRPVLTLIADDNYPHLFRIRYPDGWTSTAANISRAKDAAYGHARWLLNFLQERREEGNG
jgi:hypothetical protein